MALTNIRTFLQFSKYGDVKQIEFVGNKVMAMNTIKSVFGVHSFSIIREYKVKGFLIKGTYSSL